MAEDKGNIFGKMQDLRLGIFGPRKADTVELLKRVEGAQKVRREVVRELGEATTVDTEKVRLANEKAKGINRALLGPEQAVLPVENKQEAEKSLEVGESQILTDRSKIVETYATTKLLADVSGMVDSGKASDQGNQASLLEAVRAITKGEVEHNENNAMLVLKIIKVCGRTTNAEGQNEDKIIEDGPLGSLLNCVEEWIIPQNGQELWKGSASTLTGALEVILRDRVNPGLKQAVKTVNDDGEFDSSFGPVVDSFKRVGRIIDNMTGSYPDMPLPEGFTAMIKEFEKGLAFHEVPGPGILEVPDRAKAQVRARLLLFKGKMNKVINVGDYQESPTLGMRYRGRYDVSTEIAKLDEYYGGLLKSLGVQVPPKEERKVAPAPSLPKVEANGGEGKPIDIGEVVNFAKRIGNVGINKTEEERTAEVKSQKVELAGMVDKIIAGGFEKNRDNALALMGFVTDCTRPSGELKILDDDKIVKLISSLKDWVFKDEGKFLVNYTRVPVKMISKFLEVGNNEKTLNREKLGILESFLESFISNYPDTSVPEGFDKMFSILVSAETSSGSFDDAKRYVLGRMESFRAQHNKKYEDSDLLKKTFEKGYFKIRARMDKDDTKLNKLVEYYDVLFGTFK